MRRSCILFRQPAKLVNKYIPPSERAIREYKKYQEEKNRKQKYGKYIQYGVLSLVGSAVLMYYWQPWNPYSTDVSKELRKGLWEERDGKDDYLNALKHYQLALKQSQAEGMDQLSLKYTGIVLKIAEMYEHLNMMDKLIGTYHNLSNFIFEHLIRNNIDKENPERDLLIDRDLIVITRWSMLRQKSKDKDWKNEIQAEIRDRMEFIENYELTERLPWLQIKDKDSEFNIFELMDIWAFRKNKLFSKEELKKQWIDKHVQSKDGQEFLKCWDLFRSYEKKEWPVWISSYLKLRDYFGMFELSTGNSLNAIKVLQSNIIWLTIAGIEDAVNGPTQFLNLASAWFQYGQSANSPKAYKNSELIYKKLISIVNQEDPILPITYYSLGVLYLQTNRRDDALRAFDTAKSKAVDLDQIQIIDKIDDELLK